MQWQPGSLVWSPISRPAQVFPDWRYSWFSISHNSSSVEGSRQTGKIKQNHYFLAIVNVSYTRVANMWNSLLLHFLTQVKQDTFYRREIMLQSWPKTGKFIKANLAFQEKPNRQARPIFPQYGSHVCSMTSTLCNAGSEVIKMLVRDDQRGRCRRVITWLNSLKYSGTNRGVLTPYTRTGERIGHHSTPYCHLCRSNPLCILDWKKEATAKLSLPFLRSL